MSLIKTNREPQAVDLEEIVLGTILISKDSIHTVAEILTEEAFYKPIHQIIYKNIMHLYDIGETTDLVSLTQVLKNRKTLEKVGGIEYITALTNNASMSGELEKFARVIQEKHIARKYIKTFKSAIQELYNPSADMGEVIDNIEKNSMDIHYMMSRKQDKDMKEVILKSIKSIELASKHGDKLTGIPSSHTDIDRITGGWQDTDLIFIAARPGMGKTSFVLNSIKNTAQQFKVPIGFFSLEMSATQLGQKLIAMDTDINTANMRFGNIGEHDWDLINTKGGALASLPIYIDDSAALEILDIKAKARNWKRKYGIKMIAIDYLQLIRAKGKFNNKNEMIEYISSQLKAMAKELEIPVIAISQLSREVEKRRDKRPQLHDLRDSGCLHEDTLIQCPSHKKTFRIKDLVHQNKFSIFATNFKNTNKMDAKKCFKTGKKDAYKITLLNGQTIIATKNHRFLKEDGWERLDELDIGDKLAIPISYGDFNDNISKYEISIVGHFLANGSTLKGQPIRYCCNIQDDDLTKTVIDHAIQATKKRVKPYCKDTILPKSKFRTIFFKPTFHLTHGKTSPIADIMRKYNLFDVRCKQKHIPDRLLYLSKQKTAILLKSLFSGDGTAYYTEKNNRKTLTISYSSASKKLIFGIQQLLAKIGIVSFITSSANEKKQEWYNLNIFGKSNIELFVKNVGFWNKRKNDIMMGGWNKIKNTLSGWNKYSFNEERTVCFMPIKEISYHGESNVYDIEVPEAHNFTANNIIVHNSIEQDADIVAFIYRDDYYDSEATDVDGESIIGMAEIIIAKHRNGALGSVCKIFDKETSRFLPYKKQEEVKETGLPYKEKEDPINTTNNKQKERPDQLPF